MTRTRTLMLLSVLLLAGCPTRRDPDEIKIVGTTPAPDAGTPLPTLRIASPASNTSTNGIVAVAVDVTGGTAPAAIQLLEDGNVLATLDSPAPYTFSWDTKGIADGTHTLVAKATVDGESIASAPVTITVDRTAPTVVATTPAPGATNVVLRAPIVVTFSEPILASSFTASAVTLQVGGAVVPTTPTLSSDGMSATIAIADLSSFALPATFSVALATTITDLVGNALTVPTAPWTWSVPDWIKYAPIASTTVPAVAVGPSFQPVMAYTRCIASGSTCVDDLFVAASDGQAWNSLGQVPNLIGPGSLDLDAQGHAVVAGIGAVGGSLPSLLLATWNGSAWDSSISPLGIDTTYEFTASPIVRLDPSGRPVVAWKDAVTATEADVGVARWTGTSWDRSFGKFGLTSAGSASLILDGSGNPIVGFTVGGTGFLSLPTASFRAWGGTAWTSGGSILLGEPFVAIDQASEPMMVAGATVDHYSSGAWLSAISMAVPASSNSGGFHLATGLDHKPVVAWLDTTGTVEVGLARWTGTQWNARAGLFNAAGVVATTEAPGVLVDARGSAWVYWREGSSVNVWMSNY
jgi:Bacterial Ig-like domain/Bacterial Ig domain